MCDYYYQLRYNIDATKNRKRFSTAKDIQGCPRNVNERNDRQSTYNGSTLTELKKKKEKRKIEKQHETPARGRINVESR